MRRGRFHAVWSVADALESPSCHLECRRRVGTTLTSSGMLGITFTSSGTLWIAFTPSGVSQTRWNRPHAVCDTWVRFQAVWSVPDAFEPPSRCLRHLGSPSRRLECPRRVGTALTMSWMLAFAFRLSVVSQTR
jgi:hypothetical protein